VIRPDFIRRVWQEAQASFGVVVEEREPSLGMVEGLVPTRVFPVDDVELPPLVLRMAVQARPGERRVQTPPFGQLFPERLVQSRHLASVTP